MLIHLLVTLLRNALPGSGQLAGRLYGLRKRRGAAGEQAFGKLCEI